MAANIGINTYIWKVCCLTFFNFSLLGLGLLLNHVVAGTGTFLFCCSVLDISIEEGTIRKLCGKRIFRCLSTLWFMEVESLPQLSPSL